MQCLFFSAGDLVYFPDFQISYQTAARPFSSLLVPAIPGTDQGPFRHTGPEPAQKLLVGPGEPCSDPEWPLSPHIAGPWTPQAKHNARDRGSQVRAGGQMHGHYKCEYVCGLIHCCVWQIKALQRSTELREERGGQFEVHFSSLFKTMTRST